MMLPARFAATSYLLGFLPMENVRDTLYREDNSTVRTRSGPRAMAALRNLAIDALHQAGRHDTTEATRWASRYISADFHAANPACGQANWNRRRRPCHQGTMVSARRADC